MHAAASICTSCSQWCISVISGIDTTRRSRLCMHAVCRIGPRRCPSYRPIQSVFRNSRCAFTGLERRACLFGQAWRAGHIRAKPKPAWAALRKPIKHQPDVFLPHQLPHLAQWSSLALPLPFWPLPLPVRSPRLLPRRLPRRPLAPARRLPPLLSRRRPLPRRLPPRRRPRPRPRLARLLVAVAAPVARRAPSARLSSTPR